MLHRFLTALPIAIALLAPLSAGADEDVPSPPAEPVSPPRRGPFVPAPMPAPPPRRVEIGRNAEAYHFWEASMGFIAGQRRYSDASFASTNDVAASLTAPFSNAPFDGTNVFGLRYDIRLIISYLRMTVGVDFPFATFRSVDTTAMYALDGKMRSVTVQSIRPYELRFGLGGELPVSIFAPFVDLIGAAHWANATLSVDDARAEYQAQSFGFSLRAGCRLHVKKWFFASLAGEAGLYGPVRWNAELSVGFAAGK